MRIASVTVDLLKVPLAQPYMAAGNKISEDRHVLARVTTDDGVEGFGYVVLLNAALVKPLADATRELSQLLKGMHVFEPEASWAKLVRAANWVGPGGIRQLRDRAARHRDVGCRGQDCQSAVVSAARWFS